MAKGNYIAGLDVGTTKVATVVGEINRDGQVNVVAEGSVASSGLRKGVVVDLEETVRSIQKSLEKAERMLGSTLHSAYVGIGGEHISSLNSRGVVAVSGPRSEITEEDVERVLEASRIIPLGSGREIIEVVPRDFIIDGQEGIKNPVGMSGTRLEAEAHIVTGADTFIENLMKCVEKVGITVEDLVLGPIASSDAVLGEDEKEIGVVLADIGGGTTDIAVFVEGTPVYTSVIPVGGTHMDRDIAYGLSTTLAEAERLKKDYGFALKELASDDLIKVKNVGDSGTRDMPHSLLCEITEARTQEIFNLIKKEIIQSNFADKIAAGIVLTGGTSLLKGIRDLSENGLGLPTRIGVPASVGGLLEQIRSPIYACGVGLVLHGAKDMLTVKPVRFKGGDVFQDVVEKIRQWFRTWAR